MDSTQTGGKPTHHLPDKDKVEHLGTRDQHLGAMILLHGVIYLMMPRLPSCLSITTIAVGIVGVWGMHLEIVELIREW